jgi:hypothetical protein
MLFAVRVCTRLLKLKVFHVGRATRRVETNPKPNTRATSLRLQPSHVFISVNSGTSGRPPPTHGPDDDPVCGVTAQVRCKELHTSSSCLRVRASLSCP